MKNPFISKALLLGAAALFAACSGSEDYIVKTQPPEVQPQVWQAVINNASQGEILASDSSTTRALFVGGYTDRFLPAWDDEDVVRVYKGNILVGTMTPESAYWGTKTATLTGTLTGSFEVNDQLTLYLPSKNMDLRGQTGTLQSVSTKSYQTKTITVAEAMDNILTLSDVNMDHRVTYVRFILTDENGGARLHPSQLVVHPVSGGNTVLVMDDEGNITDKGDIVLNLEESKGEYPGEIYAAILNENDATVVYNFKAQVGSDIYIGPVSSQNQYGPALGNYKGTLRGAERKMRKTTAVSTLTVAEIPEQTFTGYAIEPAVTVKDGEDELTGTDYSVSYANNTNVGEATVTVKGLADAGAVAATKYLGTKDKTFQITQATPVIVMDASTMTLVNNTDASQNTQTRTVTRVFIDNNDNGTWDEGTDYDITALCTVTYSSSSDAVATVDASTGQVTAAGPTTCTITATVAEADNWTTKSATYTVNVEQEVNGGNTVNPWDDNNGENTDDGKIYVQ